MVAETRTPEPETAMGKYIYGIIASPDGPREFTTPGLGENGGAVHTVHLMDLAAVVSDSPIVEYERTGHNMRGHTKVLEEVMQEFALLPVRFGTLAPSAEAIQEQVLRRRYGELTGLVAKMEGLVELGVKAFWPESVIFQEIVEESSPEMRRLRDRITGRSAQATHFERIRLGEMVEAAMETKRDEDAEKILARLRPLADEHKLNQVHHDRMILNGAFLVGQERQAEFDEAVSQLDDEMAGRLFKYVGPVPAYNFVSVVIFWDE